MPSSSSIQFYGVTEVLNAAKNRNCPGWAIFQSRQFMFKCELESIEESLQVLEQTLDCIEHSDAMYTIKFFETEDGKKAKLRIKENTPCDGSFNFRMIEQEEREQRKQLFASNSGKTLGRIDSLEQKFDKFLELYNQGGEEDEDDGPVSFEKVALGYIDDPNKLKDLAQAMQMFKPLFSPAAPVIDINQGGMGRMGQIGNPETPAAPRTGENLSQAEMQQRGVRVAAALDTLERNDPKIVEHLEKLAAISQNNKPGFSLMLNMLDAQ